MTLKSILTSLILALAALLPMSILADDFCTDNTGAVYTLAKLADIPESGIVYVGGDVYTMHKNVKINNNDKMEFHNTGVLKMADGVKLTLTGHFYSKKTKPEGRLLITRLSENDKPAGIAADPLLSDTLNNIRNIDFEYAALNCTSQFGFDIDSCSFKYANGIISSQGAIAVGIISACFKITNCDFEDNEVPAIGCAANYNCGLTIENCNFINNNTSNTNKPQLNLTVGAGNPIIIKDCILKGSGLDMVGGIAVGNLLLVNAENKVIIENCEITDHRYGITGIGPMNMEIRNNTLIDNNHETNPMNGGSGISLSGYGYDLNAIISGNHIENSLWGVTLINCKDVNLGQIDNPDSPGNNVFVNNGNNGVAYDLYNNQKNDVYAQNNTWSVPEQTAELIETVIFHKADAPQLGEVIFMPAHDAGSLSSTLADKGFRVVGNQIVCDMPVMIYNSLGQIVKTNQINPNIDDLTPGIYIAKSKTSSFKFSIH